MYRLLAFSLFSLLAVLQAGAFPFPFMPLGGGEASQPTGAVIHVSGALDFECVSTGLQAEQTLWIAETAGMSPLTVSGIVYPSGFSGAWSGVVAAGGRTNVTVVFSPANSAEYGGTITVPSDAVSGVNTAVCSGRGTTMRITEAYRDQYSLPEDHSDDFVDLDGDGYNTLEEWMAGTNPRDGDSYFECKAPSVGTGFVVSWPGVEGRRYCLWRSTNLVTGFEVLATGIEGVAPVTSYEDAADAGACRVYRVEIEVE